VETDSKIILGIDPGTLQMGYGIVLINGSQLSYVQMEVLSLSPKLNPYDRLSLIFKKVKLLIKTHKATEFAIEAPFFGKNVQSMLKLGRAQGVAIAAAIESGLPVVEYSPRKVKQYITGNGNSDKTQVWKMLQQILKLPPQDDPKTYDATDALAVAVCHYFQLRTPSLGGGKKFTGWDDFIKNNPKKVGK